MVGQPFGSRDTRHLGLEGQIEEDGRLPETHCAIQIGLNDEHAAMKLIAASVFD